MTDLSARLGLPLDRAVRCVVIGAHPDDIEIGAGGTIMRLLTERPDTKVRWIVLSGSKERAHEALASAKVLAGTADLEVRTMASRDGYLPYLDSGATKEAIASLADPTPDLVLSHRRDDAHQDHRFASDLTWQIFRWSLILEYEIPKWDGDLGTSNLYVTLGREIAEAKVAHILSAFPSQLQRDWFNADTFRAILTLRGIEARSPSGAAEAFVARKVSI
jgi:LmbE family N-acetylglucosaminyl deacetylase